MFVVAVEDFLLRDGRLQKSNATGFEPHTNAKISGVDRWMTDDRMRTCFQRFMHVWQSTIGSCYK